MRFELVVQIEIHLLPNALKFEVSYLSDRKDLRVSQPLEGKLIRGPFSLLFKIGNRIWIMQNGK